MIDATTSAAASPAYSSSRSDQGKGAGKDFLSALADTADRGQGQAADDNSVDQDTPQKQVPSTSSAHSKTSTSTATTTSVSSADDTVPEGTVTSTDAEEAMPVKTSATMDAKTTAALIAKALASASSSAAATEATAGQAETETTEQATTDKAGATDALAKLVAALTQQDQAATETAAATATETPVSQDTGKTAAKKTDSQLLAALSALKQAAGGDAAAEATTNAQAETPTETAVDQAVPVKAGTKQGTKDSDDTKDVSAAQNTAAGVQDALSLLANSQAGQLQQIVKATGAASTTDAGAVTGTTGQDAMQTTKSAKTGTDLPTTDLSKSVKTGQASSADTTGEATHGLKESSAADALHLVTSSDKEAVSIDDAPSQQTATVDPLQNVSVLDSRRIIAPASTSNGANIAAAMSGDSSWAQAMHSHAADRLTASEQASTDRTMNTLKLKMTPESLGNVTATLKLTNGELTVSLVVENSAAYRKLNEDQSSMVSALKNQGFSVDQIQISIASTEKSNTDSGQTNAQSQNGNQQGMQQGNGSAGQGGNRSQPNVAFDLSGQTSTGTADDTARTVPVGTGGNASGASGQLYL